MYLCIALVTAWEKERGAGRVAVGGTSGSTGSGCVEQPGIGAASVFDWGVLLWLVLLGSDFGSGGNLKSTALSLVTESLRPVQGLNSGCDAGMYSILFGVGRGI